MVSSMSVALQLLALLSFSCDSAHGRAMVKVSPPWLQFSRYDSFSLSCEGFHPGEGRVWRYTQDSPQLSRCGKWGQEAGPSVCNMDTVVASATGVYWCQSEHGSDSSDAVGITVNNGEVTLQSPARPMKKGEDITLRCHSESLGPGHSADFYKNNTLLRTEPSGHMTLLNVSTSDRGSYKCIMGGHSSPSSWLHVEGEAAPLSLSVSPNTSQFFEYKNVTLSCSQSSAVVMRFQTQSGNEVGRCGKGWGKPTGAGCQVVWAKRPHSGVYWCQTPWLQRSASVNITFHSGNVILQSPALAVTEGDVVSLRCVAATASITAHAEFYKDGALIRTEPSGHMTLPVSKADEGFYSCKLGGHGKSPSSWLSVRGSPSPAPTPSPSSLRIIRLLVVIMPYCISTVLMLSECCPSPAGKKARVSMATPRPDNATEEEDAQYDDVTTEHRF